MIVSPRSSRNARHYYLYSWSPCFTPPYITRITTNNLSSTCTPTILRCWNRTFVLSWCASLFSSSQRILFRFSVHLPIWRHQIDCFSLNHWLCTIWFLTKLIFFVPSNVFTPSLCSLRPSRSLVGGISKPESWPPRHTSTPCPQSFRLKAHFLLLVDFSFLLYLIYRLVDITLVLLFFLLASYFWVGR